MTPFPIASFFNPYRASAKTCGNKSEIQYAGIAFGFRYIALQCPGCLRHFSADFLLENTKKSELRMDMVIYIIEMETQKKNRARENSTCTLALRLCARLVATLSLT